MTPTARRDAEPAAAQDSTPTPGRWSTRVPVVRTIAGRAPVLAARTSAVLGLVTLVDVLWADHWSVLSTLDVLPPGPVDSAVRVSSAVSALCLLRVAAGLRRGKRAEWRVATTAVVVIGTLALIRSVERPVQSAIAVALLAVLLIGQDRFRARSDPRNGRVAVRSAGALAVLGVLTGTIMISVPGHVAPGTSLWARLHEVLVSMIGLGGSVQVSGDAYNDAFHAILLTLGLTALAWALLVMLRPSAPETAMSTVDERRLRALLERHGARDSLGYFALRRDKLVTWSPTGKAAVTYRVVAGVALVSADPIGDPEAWPGAIHAFDAQVAAHGWTPAVMGCSELGASVYARESGFSALELGDEATLHAADFALDGRAMRGVRQACARIERGGYHAEVRRVADVPADELDRLRERADAWRTDPIERGFSMALSRLGDPADGRCVVVTAHQDGELRGLLHFVPWGAHGISLDLMRRDRESDNGLNEYMISAVMAHCAQLDVERVSLNFAVFRDALERGARIGAGPVLRFWRRILLIASRWWQIDSLYRFNSKFRPHWEPRFVCYPRARDLPRISLAAMEAEAFLVRPAVLKRLLGRG